MMRFVFLFLLVLPKILLSQTDVPHTLYKQFNGSYGYTLIGSSHNVFDNMSTTPVPCQMLTSSSSALLLSPSQTIIAAYLIWSGIGNGIGTSLSLNSNIQLPDFLNYANINPPTFPTFPYFSALKDISSYAQSFGNGIYQINNYDLNPFISLYCSNFNYFSGWNIIVVYSDPNLPNCQLNIYDGFRYLVNGNTAITVQIDNLNITDTANAKMTIVSWNGSPNIYFGESILLNSDTLNNSQNPVNNPFNSTNSFTGSTTSWNMDIDTYNISNNINLGDTNANITVNSLFLRFLSTIITSISSELPDATVTLDSISGQDLCQNRDLAVDFTVFNVNSNDTLPAGTPISFFVNDSIFVSTVLTPSQILIGDSLAMSALVSIPAGISSPFSLSIIANQDSTELGVIPESNLTNNVSNDTILSLNEIFIPTFDSIAPVCFGTNVVLPTTSTNGVAGTWSPAFNNQATTTYLFIPNGNNCIDSVELTVQIVPQTLPTFGLADSICANGTLVFPTISSNSVIGSWSPAFDNQNSATYTFSPDSVGVVSEGCPVSTQKLVTIVPQTVPSFSFVDSLCVGASFSFPNTSDNGIVGTWSAAFNNQTTTSYTFTPTSSSVFNGCALNVTETITIIPTLQPTFTIADSLCADVVFSLPASSNENVLGTWSPAFNNQTTQNYSFTPNSSGIVSTTLGARCPLTATQNVVIVPRTPTPFSLPDSICVGASLTLPTTSNNAISGTWSPVFNNQATTLYTFSPTVISVANNCPLSAQSTIIVDPFVQPIFVSIDSICQGNLVTLPTLSENLINGNWSPAFDNQSTTNYTFTPSDPGCISTAQMTVPVFPLITPSFSIADSICQNDTLIFPTISDNSISGTWSPAFDNQQTTTYTFTPNANECAAAVQFTVQVFPRITPSFSLFDSLCAGNSFVFPTLSDNNISGSWSPPLNNQLTTNYTFIHNVFECATSTNFTLVVLPTPVTFDTLIFCENDLPFVWNGQTLTASTNTSATLQDQFGCDSLVNFSFQVLPIQFSTFSVDICENDPDYVWQGVNYNQTGSYPRTFTAQNGCDSVVALNFTVRPAPPADFSVVPFSGCLPLEINFINNQITPNTSVLWDFGNGQTDNSVNQTRVFYTQNGCYDVRLTVTNQFACVAEQFLVNAVCIDPNPDATFTVQKNPLSLLDPTAVLINNSTNASSFVWDFGDGNSDATRFSPSHTFPEQAGSYQVSLVITNENGCQDSTFQTITIEQNPLFFVPNSFTPDKNEFNDIFRPVFSDNLNVSQYNFKIFNRWGELLFETRDPQTGWDGSFGGKLVQDGVYVYSLEFREAGFTKVFREKGNVNLVR